MPADTGALEFIDVHKSFGAVRALQGVSFTVAAGDAHAVVGENGAGKSTLLKILAGIARPDRGEVRLNGKHFNHANPRDALAGGIGMVFQERLAFPNLTVAGNIFAGREMIFPGGRLNVRAMRDRTQALLHDLRLSIDPDLPMEHASAAVAQLVQVARALAFECRVLVLDEPTTSLTDAEVDHLFRILLDLKQRGVTLLFVSHRLPEVFRLCDRITVLRDGRFAGTFDRATTSPDTIVRAMVGREPPARIERPLPPASAAPVLSAQSLSRAPWFTNVSCDVRAGEIVGIFGLVGSGRTELLETLFGLAAPTSGRMLVDGRDVTFESARDASAAGLALVPEDRQRLGLHFNLSIRHNIALARAARAGLGPIDTAEESRMTESLATSLAIRVPHLSATPDALSGGNQQKVVLAKALGTSPKILLLDEPTKGVDVGAKFDIHNLIRERAAAGMACLVVSSDLPEILALVDRVVVMREGEVRGMLDAAEATEERIMQLATHEVAVTS